MRDSHDYPHDLPRIFLQEDLKKIALQQESASWSNSESQIKGGQEENQFYPDEFYLYEVRVILLCYS